MDKISEVDIKTPKGECAVVDNSPLVQSSMHKERAVEGIKRIMDNLSGSADFAPVVFGRVNGEIIATACEIKDGVFVLPDFSQLPSSAALSWKKRRVNNIMKRIDKILRRDIGQVTEVALMRKSDDQLRAIENALKRKKNKSFLSRVSLRNRVGCIFLEVDDETVQI